MLLSENEPLQVPPPHLNKVNLFIKELRTNRVYLLIPVIALIILFSGVALSEALSPSGLFGQKEIVSPLAANISGHQEVAGIATESAVPETDETAESIIDQDISLPLTATPPPTSTPSLTSSPTPSVAPPANYTASRGRINFPNNKFGIYTYAGGDYVDLAAELVNSNGGDWGWILMPIQLTERNSENWNSIFNKAREKHLIPILQVSTNDNHIPSENEIDGIADFLGGLGWPVKIRPVTLFNEVNAAEYWGGKVDPEGYARILNHAVDKFHSLSGEFVVMNGAFNSSAHTVCVKTDLGVDTCYLGLDEYMRRMNAAVPGIFKKLDAWANHSYPHPGYRGSPYDSTSDQGRLTIRAYKYDLRLLAQYGVSLPVFITETGWPHKEGNTAHNEWLDQNTVADYYRIAFSEVWLKDPSIVAVTPFQLKRDDFDNFAFVAPDGSKFPQWNALTSISKVAGAPPVN
ncbi:MAG: hypothetical protein AAB486_03185 [Patescibacteria group bacterium]